MSAMDASDGALGEVGRSGTPEVAAGLAPLARTTPSPDLPVYSIGQNCAILTQISRRTNSQLSSLK
jgi:hypothetical protein